MKCPIDETELVMTDRQGIEIDYCPHCRGVWLDRGELDKLIERSGAAAPSPATNTYDRPREQYPSRDDLRDDHRDDDDREHYSHDSRQQHGYDKKKKKEGFLGDLFDF